MLCSYATGLCPGSDVFVSDYDDTLKEVDMSTSASQVQRCSAPDEPRWKIPHSEWPEVLYQIEQGESLRQIAKEYGVSYETVRRVMKAARRKKK